MNDHEQMNEAQSCGPDEKRPADGDRKPGWAGLWFGWWVAACLMLLAFSSYQQLQIQGRILTQSRRLKDAVAEAAAVSAATNKQLDGVRKLDAATSRLSVQLTRLAKANAAIRTELGYMEGTVKSIDDSLVVINQQTRESTELLTAIAKKSDDLQAALSKSLATGRKISSLLGEMAQVQDAVTGNLGVMVQKTAPLQRFVKEE
jgi:chromosome segregation ATPase